MKTSERKKKPDAFSWLLWGITIGLVLFIIIHLFAIGPSYNRTIDNLTAQVAAYESAIANYDRQADQFRERIARLEAEIAVLREGVE